MALQSIISTTTSHSSEPHRQKDRRSDDIDNNTIHVNTSMLNAASNAATLLLSNINHPGPRKRPSRKSESGIDIPSSPEDDEPSTQEDDVPPRRTTALTRRTLSSLFIPPKKLGKSPSFWRSMRAVMLSSIWLNLLLVFIPISWALNFSLDHNYPKRDAIVFTTSAIAILPLAKLLGFATEELSLRVGQTLAGLLNATLGNAVELLVAILALVQCELRIVQTSLVGSILSNLLLVLGMCFVAGGYKYKEQGFGQSVSQLNASLLTISVIAVLLPAAFQFGAHLDEATERREILIVSRGTAILLLAGYIGYLAFQLRTHSSLFDENHAEIFKSTRYARTEKKRAEIKRRQQMEREAGQATTILSPGNGLTDEPESHEPTVLSNNPSGTNNPVSYPPVTLSRNDVESVSVNSEESVEEPQMSASAALILLVLVTALTGVTAEWLVLSIDGMTSSGAVSKEFIGIIVLPFIGNAAEHFTAVTVSVKDKLTLSTSIAIGSSIQIALFVVPLIVTIGWCAGKPMTLLFDPFESISLFLAVLTVNYVVQDGRSNWLEGYILILLYAILALSFWYYPGSEVIGC